MDRTRVRQGSFINVSASYAARFQAYGLSLTNRLFRLQFLGPFALFAATLCAELAAHALEYVPGSELLWFVNLRSSQRSSALLSYIVTIDGFQFFGLALPIFLLACLGLAARSQAPVHD